MSAPPYDNNYQSFCNDNATSIAHPHNAPQKKPRHRHSPHQLAALNELFEQNEHPPLEQRSALAERLGMETKTVNAWFQNKRASSKKRVRGVAASHDSRSVNRASVSSPSSAPSPRNQPAAQDFHRADIKEHDEDEYTVPDMHSRSTSQVPPEYPPSVHSGRRDQSLSYPDPDPMAPKFRNRPSSDQTDELVKLYSINPHPTAEQCQAVAASLGMRYQTIMNWFQNQRNLDKKKRDNQDDATSLSGLVPKSEFVHEKRHYSAFPPPSHPHPSLALPPPTSHPSLMHPSMSRRSLSVSPPMDGRSPRRSSSRHSTTPYTSAPPAFARPRRTRPEPYQLEALKKLFRKTATPTIEERSALALEIGMDVGKVTNWFRNLRQTARKRARKSGSGDEDDDGFHAQDPYSASASVSRSGTPSPGSSTSSLRGEDSMDMDDFDTHPAHSADNSEDEYQEAVTPPPEPSPSPPPVFSHTSRSHGKLDLLLNHIPPRLEIEKPSVERFPGIKMEDALLLLSFHRHIVQY
ncbi:homeobox domain-containing protein [Crepidotus variabilis]|uniref:Homeobox domain-containing protein n=1 Tax=Crepidotus variabilis TaxID=179855 RepID=A0A9P6EN63_9AGAR|nr:homeobox domain-containing protein [Crepidotus variabilis]